MTVILHWKKTVLCVLEAERELRETAREVDSERRVEYLRQAAVLADAAYILDGPFWREGGPGFAQREYVFAGGESEAYTQGMADEDMRDGILMRTPERDILLVLGADDPVRIAADALTRALSAKFGDVSVNMHIHPHGSPTFYHLERYSVNLPPEKAVSALARDAARYRALRALCEGAVGAIISANDHRLNYENAPEGDGAFNIHWYPNTPVGYNVVGGATFDEMADAAVAEATVAPPVTPP